MAQLNYEIIENIGILSTASNGWTKEINLVSWNDGEAKYDIRNWNPEHSRMSKGVTLTKEETKILKEVLNSDEELN
ncbi:MAG: PC4/YdbC family ssDNA-binding protein [Peptoniphilaceae bacterium]|nr:PC4/YdbC family ssDNA-binding protein [Peptoniphilaceae bacterium]MDY3737756.1 PC4/YdbC family ssDNA-binding protein [Peptoniphilaceae bacterium]